MKKNYRTMIADSLKEANIKMLSEETLNNYVSGNVDILMHDVQWDSLNKMEFCIALELNYKISIAPNDLEKYLSLHALAIKIEEMENDKAI